MKNTAVKKKSGLVYLLALLPVLSVGVYLLLMAFGQTEDFAATCAILISRYILNSALRQPILRPAPCRA